MNKKIAQTLIRAKKFFLTAETKLEFVLNVLIVVLAISVLVLGALLAVRYQFWLKAGWKFDTLLSREEQSQNVDVSLTSQPASAEEDDLLNLTSEEMADRYQEVQAAAVEASQIVVNACRVEPAIAIVTLGQALMVENQNSFPVSLNIGEEVIELAANSAQEVTPSFKHGIGTYGYHCDSQGRVQSPNQNTGIFIVKE